MVLFVCYLNLNLSVDHNLLEPLEIYLNREFSAEKPLQKLCLDITYIKVNHPYPKWIYLCAVKDLYNHEIVAYDVSPTQNMMQVFRVLNQVSKLPLQQIKPFYIPIRDPNLQINTA